MPSNLRRNAVALARRSLRYAVSRPATAAMVERAGRGLQRLSEIASREIESAARPGEADSMPFADPHGSGRPGDDGLYGAAYFGDGRNPDDRENLSGYGSYDRESSNANLQAYVTWRVFDATTTLDIGCALGYSVEAFRELGFDAQGSEYSGYAVDHCAPGAKGHIRQGDLLKGLPYEDAQFDLVTAFEILEHLPPEDIPRALAEIRRVTKSFVFATIPSFGPNEFGPGGWHSGKVLDSRLDYYNSLPPAFQGPIPYEDLNVDKAGHPLEGHLCIASFSWWQAQFEAAGFEKCGELERRMYPIIDRFGLTGWWCLHVFRVPGAALPKKALRTKAEITRIESAWELAKREEMARLAHEKAVAAEAAASANTA